MPQIIQYNRKKALEYTTKWALSRNPKFFDFENIGGDCTNFVSQVLLAGGSLMNYTKDTGWYYINTNNRSPSWTGANFLYYFLIKNKVLGPFAIEVDIDRIEVGDIIQLNFENDYIYDHSLIVTSIIHPRNYNNILISSHTKDRLNVPLSTIIFEQVRFLHVIGSYK